jgi:hypothetical protein
MEYPGQTAPGQCYRCGYDLRGIADDQPCPECGLLAERSRRVTDELHNTRPKWLRTIARGSNLILLAIVTVVAWTLFLHNDVGFIVSYMSMRHPDFGLWGLDFALLIFLLGVALLTRREGYAPADLADRWLRRLLRVVPLFLVAAAVTEWIYFAIFWPQRYFSDDSAVIPVLMLLCFAGSFLLPFLIFLRLRGLAVRARSAHLAEHCLIVGIGASLAICYIFAIGFTSYYSQELGLDNYWWGRSNVALVLMLVMATGGILFILWSLYLLIRFTISFNRAARQLRHKWTRDDRAA